MDRRVRICFNLAARELERLNDRVWRMDSLKMQMYTSRCQDRRPLRLLSIT